MKRFALSVAALLGIVISSCAKAPPSDTVSHPPSTFKDCEGCPEMVVIPPGTFRMGAPPTEKGRCCLEWPVRDIRIRHSFALSRFEVTFAEWENCINDGSCKGYRPTDQGWGRADRPVINVSWQDAQEYVNWLSQKTNRQYRLPSESEWEYAARAGTTTRYWWGKDVGYNKANCDGCGSPWDRQQTAPIGSFRANAFGLFDMHGNVGEYVQDCYGGYSRAPTDGSPRLVAPGSYTKCLNRVVRGGSWMFHSNYVRSASRDYIGPSQRFSFYGFRVATTISIGGETSEAF